jgi:hypothetical protein
MDRIEDAIERFTAATRTVGSYPDSQRLKLRNYAGLSGPQMLTPIGRAVSAPMYGSRDGIEPEGCMVRWIVDNHVDPSVTSSLWMHIEAVAEILAARA